MARLLSSTGDGGAQGEAAEVEAGAGEVEAAVKPEAAEKAGAGDVEARAAEKPKVSLATRHVMQANKSKNTKPELVVRRALRAAGLPGYRLHWKKCPGRPDVCYPGRKIAIFVNGCFWHRCPHCNLSTPKSNVAFWEAKFARNRARDQRNREELVAAGWTVLVVWECALKKQRRETTLANLVREIELASLGIRPHGRVVEVGYMGALRHRASWRRWHTH